MTAFVTIPDARLEPDAPVRSVDAIALRDNPMGIIEGDATAVAAGHQIRSGAIMPGDTLTNNVGWHGSLTRIKLTPQDFMPYYPPGAAVYDIQGRYTVIENGSYAIAKVDIPTGFKATTVMVYASSNMSFVVYEGKISDGTTATVKSTAAVCNSSESITNVSAAVDNYLTIVVQNTSGLAKTIYGGYVTIALI